VKHAIATAGSFIPNVYKSQTQMHALHSLLFYNPATKIKRTGKCTLKGCIKLF
jgi:hypothetical protein